ncbi:hypothetical protein Tco_0578431 [Tanacetum coccineum]
MISLGLSLSESFLVVGIDCRVLVNSSPSGSISLILACHAPSPFLGGLFLFIGLLIKSFDSHMLLLRFMGVCAPTPSELGRGLYDSLFPSVVQYGASSSPKSTLFTPNTDLVILSPTAILAILQFITALAVARNPLPTSKGVSRYSGIMFKYDPKSAKVLKGFESPNLQGRVNSPRLESELGLRELLACLANVCLLGTCFDSIIEVEECNKHWGSMAGCHQDCFAQKCTTYLPLCRYAKIHIQQRLVQDLSCNTECRGDHCRSHMSISVTKLATGRLVNGSSCDGINMVIKDLDLESKINAMMRDFLYPSLWKELSKETSSKILPCGDGSC